MSIADDMKKLTEDIVASYDVRVKAVGAIVKQTAEMLKGFNSEHKEMAAKLSSDLAAFISEHKEMAAKLKADLTEFVNGLVKETTALVKKFQAEHKGMAEELKADLAKGETERLKAFKGMMGDIRKGVKDIEAYVARKLQEFTDAHADMSAELKKELAKYVANIVSDTGKLLSGYAGEREKMAANWQDMVATLARKRGGKPVKVEAGEEVKTVAEAVKKPRKKARKGKRKSKKDNWSL